MSKLIVRLLAVMALGWVGSSSAGPIVIVDGKDWLQPVDFLRLNWNDVSSKCNATTGACTGVLGSSDVTGYTWASVDDVNALFNYFLPDDPMGPGPMPEQPFSTGSFYPLLLNAGFISTSLGEPPERLFVAGVTRSVLPNDTGSAYTAIAGNYTGGPYDFATTNDATPKFARLRDSGSWFYRDPSTETVPLPATLPLLGIGLTVLGLSHRLRKLHN
jgi:hypothetical protein